MFSLYTVGERLVILEKVYKQISGLMEIILKEVTSNKKEEEVQELKDNLEKMKIKIDNLEKKLGL